MTSAQDPEAEVASQLAIDINTISTFLSNSQISSLYAPITTTHPSTPSSSFSSLTTIIHPSTVIIAASAILHQAHTIFSFFHPQSRIHTDPTYPTTSTSTSTSSITTLLLTGGVGHSTLHLYAAILQHPIYHKLPSLIGRSNNDLTGLSEAQLFYLIFVHFYDGEAVVKHWNGGEGMRVLVEGESTNCGANATMSRQVLEQSGVRWGEGSDGGDDVLIIQDPTMSLRSKVSFEKVYEKEIEDGRVRFWTWPTFVPCVKTGGDGGVVWDGERMSGVDVKGLWDMKRFYGLILGEVSRLRDDENGYGPKGKGFIAHVDVSGEVERAWDSLSATVDFKR